MINPAAITPRTATISGFLVTNEGTAVFGAEGMVGFIGGGLAHVWLIVPEKVAVAVPRVTGWLKLRLLAPGSEKLQVFAVLL